MPLVQCVWDPVTKKGCGRSWNFGPKKPSTLLKRSYWVRCPDCGNKVFRRIKRSLMSEPIPEKSLVQMAREAGYHVTVNIMGVKVREYDPLPPIEARSQEG